MILIYPGIDVLGPREFEENAATIKFTLRCDGMDFRGVRQRVLPVFEKALTGMYDIVLDKHQEQSDKLNFILYIEPEELEIAHLILQYIGENYG